MVAEEFKVIIVGESGVGKTSFVVRFAEGKFLNVFEATVGVDCKKVCVEIQETQVELHIWDTAGQERFKSIINRFFRSAHGVIIMYDVTQKATFDEVPWWLREVRHFLPDVPVVLVGNKNDGERQAEVLDELAQDFADENRLYLYHTSARDNVNVKEVFYSLATMMLIDRNKDLPEPTERSRLWNSGEEAFDVRKMFLRQKDERAPKRTCCSYLENKETRGYVV